MGRQRAGIADRICRIDRGFGAAAFGSFMML
jgi:hypothetical protein